MFTDNQKLPITTTSAAAADHYNHALTEYFDYRLSAGKSAKAALTADPEFVLGHCLRGYFNMLIGSTEFYAGAREHLDRALLGVAAVSRREQLHVRALEAWLAGDTRLSCRLWADIVAEQPQDLLALRLHHFASFWRGRQRDLRALPAQALGAWDRGMPGYGNVLGMLAFGLEECGDYPAAEALGRQAVSLNPDDMWALHAVAHVLEMQGRLEEGLSWLNQPADHWIDRNPFRGHLWWHKALYFLELGDYEQVLDLYDQCIHDEKSIFYLDIQNQASLLLRLDYLGVEVTRRWAELADFLETRLDDHVLTFTDIHTMMALAAAGREPAMARFIESLQATAACSLPDQAAIIQNVTIPLCTAIAAQRRGEQAAALQTILDIEPDLAVVGASHAQRDIFELLRLEAAIGAQQYQRARALLSERTILKPNSLGSWQKYARVLEALGETRASARARGRVEQFVTALPCA